MGEKEGTKQKLTLVIHYHLLAYSKGDTISREEMAQLINTIKERSTILACRPSACHLSTHFSRTVESEEQLTAKQAYDDVYSIAFRALFGLKKFKYTLVINSVVKDDPNNAQGKVFAEEYPPDK